MRKGLAFVALFFFSIATAHAETLLCAQEVAGGLKYLNGAWMGTPFNNNNASQYAITSQPSDPMKYSVKELGKSIEVFSCDRYRLPNGDLMDALYCGGPAWGMVINFSKLRYVEMYSHGYINDDRSGDNTPFVAGGKCSVINP